MEYLEANHPEWSEMWQELGSHPINNGDPVCEFMGKGWEYMGSTQDHHHLRHPIHPTTGKVEFIYIERSKVKLAWAS